MIQERIKYSRTFHLPFSEGVTSDDKILLSLDQFIGKEVIVSEKIDGECSCVYPDGYTHARSLDSKHHPSRSWLKNYASTFCHDIPTGYRIYGENVFAFHSIFYTNLPSYFLLFGIYEGDKCLSWEETVELSQLLGLHTVPIIYQGVWDEQLIRKLWNGIGAFPTFETDKQNPVFPCDFFPCQAEGFVVRLAEEFSVHDFSHSVAKMVRPNHVKTDSHWMEKTVIQNLLKESQNG